MNAVNPENVNSVFIPDPWTSSSPTKNFFIIRSTEQFRQW